MAASADKAMHPIIAAMSAQNVAEGQKKPSGGTNLKSPASELQQGDAKNAKFKVPKKKSPSDLKFMESMTLEEFASSEKLDKNMLSTAGVKLTGPQKREAQKEQPKAQEPETNTDSLDPLVLLEGRPAKQGAALDRQITLFYKMECCICHENGFHFRSLMKHYKERHGVPGYVTCCDKKFHYFYPKKIIEHMAFHLQPNIFM